MIIDTLKHEIAYLIYEPVIQGKSILGWPLTPPVNGQREDFPVAQSEQCLYDYIDNKKSCSLKAYSDLVKTPRDITFFDNILK